MTPKNFHHPFQPYDIQQQFMEALYACIEDGKVGIFESPTGTGKSLSLICGALTWLREHKRKTLDDALAATHVDDEDDDPDWMNTHASETRRLAMKHNRSVLEKRLDAVRERERKIRQRSTNEDTSFKRRKRNDDEPAGSSTEEEQFILEDYASGDDAPEVKMTTPTYSSEAGKLMEQLGMVQSPKQKDDAVEEVDELKVFFCSRTHSQLSQFAGELQRVRLPATSSAAPIEHAAASDGNAVEELKQLSLGSRKNLCINRKVLNLGDQSAINERCIELQQLSVSVEQRCNFLPTKANEDVVLDFRDHALAKIHDIEDLAKLGIQLQICPYYASRPAIGPAEMVTLPYPLLLQKSARDALGISLKGHVVIIDEAHNLINAIESIYSTSISERQLQHAREALMVYLQKFRNRLKGSNRVYVTQLVRVIDSLLLFFVGLSSLAHKAGTLEVSQLLSGKAADQVNLSKLVRYMSDSKLARKVEGYILHISKGQDGADADSRNVSDVPKTPTLMHVQNFFMTLMNPSNEGRFFWSREADVHIVRYMLLDPSENFHEVVKDARAVILAGGTMAPMEEYQQRLFPYLPTIRTFSCGHLIPPSNLLVRNIASDPRGRLDFSFKGRSHPSTAFRIGAILLEIAPFVQGGLVVFFPSYGFLEEIYTRWRSEALIPALEKIKPVFCDSREASAEKTFETYSHAVSRDYRGAILMSVLGGKLSEGINFSDDLGRCVIVVGLPFPNLETPEWKAKMQYIEDNAVGRGEPRGKASREYAENVCMRSVNQAIGRVIRHKSDWASILLMDGRYADQRIREKLPGWIKESFPQGQSSIIEDVKRDFASFFQKRKATVQHIVPNIEHN